MIKALLLLLLLPCFGQAAQISLTPADDFDAVMKAAPVNTSILLAPGTYFTDGNIDGTSRDTARMWVIKSGWTLRGAGMHQTRIVLTNANVAGAKYHVLAADGNAANNVTIADLTLDANGGRFDQSNNRSGLALRGSNNTVSKVRVVGWGSKTTATECFVIGLFAHGGDAWHNLIDGCVVSEPSAKAAGTGFTAITHSVTDVRYATRFPVIRNCRVDNLGGHQEVYSHGYTLYGASHGLLETSSADGVWVGVNWDTFGLDSATIRNNRFSRVARGVFFKGLAQNCHLNELIIQANQVVLTPGLGGPATVAFEINGYELGVGTPLGEIMVRDNIISIAGGPDPASSSRIALIRGATNVVVINNQAHFAAGTPALGGRYNKTVVATGNINLAGQALAYLAEPESGQPTPAVPIAPVLPPLPPTPAGVYVSPQGAAGNAGTFLSPISLVSAMSAATPAITSAKARKIILRGGKYSLASTISPSLAGTATSPWVLEPYPGEVVTFDINTGARHGFLFTVSTCAYIEFRNIRFTDSSLGARSASAFHLVKLDRGTGIGFSHCVFDNSKWSGILCNGPASGTWFYGCVIANNGVDTQFDHGIYAKSLAGTFSVENCFLVSNAGHQLHFYNSSTSTLEGIRGMSAIDNAILTYGEPNDRFILFQDSGPKGEARDCVATGNICYNLFPGAEASDQDRSTLKITNPVNSRVEGNFVWGGNVVGSTLTNTIMRASPWKELQTWARKSKRNPNIIHATVFNPNMAHNVGIDLTGLLANGPYSVRAASSPAKVCATGVYSGGFINLPTTNLVYDVQLRTGGHAWPGTPKANGYIITRL